MKTIIKRIVIGLYCHEWISFSTTRSLFKRFKLKEA
jgi:hypothetical protein